MAKTKLSTPPSAPKRHFGPPVPFSAVDETEVKVPFEERKRTALAYYVLAIQKLIAGEASVLRFEGTRCRAQLGTNAKKLGVKLLYAEQGGRLYVKLANDPGSEAILSILKTGPKTRTEITEALTAKQMTEIVPAKILKSLSEAGHIKLDADSRWRLTAA